MSSIQRRSLGIYAFAAVFAAGCGGGSQSATQSAGASKTSKIGDASITYFGQPKPQITASSSAVGVVGQAGANFSTVTLEPSPNLNETYLTFERYLDGEWVIYTVPATGGPAQLVYQDSEGGENPAASAYGTIAFNNDQFGMFSIRPDGTGLRSIAFTGLSQTFCPSYSVDGTNRLSFCDLNNHLYIGPGTGGTPTLVQSNSVGDTPAWNPTGTELAYIVQDAGADNSDIYTTATSGGTPFDVVPTTYQNTGEFATASWSADGKTMVAMYRPNASSDFQTAKFSATDHSVMFNLTPSGDSDGGPCFSPDGSKIAFYRTNANGATPGIYLSDAAGGNQTLLLADPTGGSEFVGSLSWSPFLPKETVAAASGSTFYHAACSGFLLSQVGNQFGSFVAFTAATPADAAIQSPAQSSGSSPLLFTLTADSITQIGYINNYFDSGTTVTLSSTPSVVVSIDAVTGQVDTVAPAAIAKAPAVKNADGTMTYNAPFKAIYNGKGQNLAPNGASQMTLNPKTGKLVTFK